MGLVSELQRRNVLRVGAAYVVVAWLLIQVAETIFPLFGFDDTPARIVVILLAIGFVPALVFAWAFELTPEGLKRETAVNSSRSITQRTGKKLDQAIMVVLALALGFFALDKFILDPARDASRMESAREQGRNEVLVGSYGEKSIAVLAFEDMSPHKDQEYLSDGIAEELLNLLAKIPELRVISRSSSFFYKGKDINLAQVAEELNVTHILEGSVRKSGDRVRITAQLIEARADTHLWSEKYDRTLDDIFAIQDDIAAEVVAKLKVTLLDEAPHLEEIDAETYTLFLKARHLARQNTVEGNEQSIVLLKQVLSDAPHFAPAWDELAIVYSSQANAGLRPQEEARALARQAADQALAANPDYAPAHASLGMNAMAWDGDLAAAARHLERALQLAPTDVDVIGSAATLLLNLGRVQPAITLLEYLAARDPIRGPSGSLAIAYARVGRWDEAIASDRIGLRRRPHFIGRQYNLGKALLYKGDVEAALAAIQEEQVEGFRMRGLVMVYHAMGQQEDSDTVLNDFIEKYEEVDAYGIALVLAYRNEADRAFEWLHKAVEYGDPGLTGVANDPSFSNIHSDPRWLPFLASIGKSPEQLDVIDFAVTLPQ